MELFHLINRGIDGRKIFMDNSDRVRFVHDLYEFNDITPSTESIRRKNSESEHLISRQRERIVDIHGWKLMENHTHLLISERVENGLSIFMRKMSGYARYFNERHQRRGQLYEKGTKKVQVKSESHFLYILHYIHLNGLDDFPDAKEWRERDKGSVYNIDGAIKHLQDDRWSSYSDYCGVKNFPSILTKTLFSDEFTDYESDIKKYLKDRESMGKYSMYLE